MNLYKFKWDTEKRKAVDIEKIEAVDISIHSYVVTTKSGFFNERNDVIIIDVDFDFRINETPEIEEIINYIIIEFRNKTIDNILI